MHYYRVPKGCGELSDVAKTGSKREEGGGEQGLWNFLGVNPWSSKP